MTAVTAPQCTGPFLTRELVRWFESRLKAPIMFTEIALDGTYGSLGRLDAVACWLIKDSGIALWGYEVKASRADFFRDVDQQVIVGKEATTGKWRKYLAPLSSFYFATPAGLVKPDEVPDPAGLIVYSPLKRTWNVVKKAGATGGKVKVDTVARLLRRDHGIGQGHVVRLPPRLSEAEKRTQRLEAKAAYESEAMLASLINGRVKDTIRAIRAREANIDDRFKVLDRDKASLEQLRVSLDGAPAAIATAVRVLEVAQSAVRGWSHQAGSAREQLAAIDAALAVSAGQVEAAAYQAQLRAAR